ncbi:MAG: pyridoxal phosphate-dependent aminotransferase [Bacteroidota bacterium]
MNSESLTLTPKTESMPSTTAQPNLVVSEMAENLIGSEIIKLGGEINERIKKGEKINNYTIGDFDPKVFPIPQELTNEIIRAMQEGHTNYPTANGILELRKAVASFLHRFLKLDYSSDEILITSGARPAIYAAYITLLDAGDKVIYPVPSWNNNHYAHLSGAQGVMVETTAANNFMPTADDLRPHIEDATLIALCSPLNPTGTTFTAETLTEICDMILEENNRRGPDEKPLYLLYDQIYWALTFRDTVHVNPVTLRPEMRNYTIFVDGLSKAFAATGIRVGWTFGPQSIIDKMKAILSHVGAWAPKAEQIASARYLTQEARIDEFLLHFKTEVDYRLEHFYNGIQQLKNKGYAVDAIAPQAAIYLTVRFDLVGMKTTHGKLLNDSNDILYYLIDEAKVALVPFSAFGASVDSTWYRLSVGTCTREEIETVINNLDFALGKLTT